MRGPGGKTWALAVEEEGSGFDAVPLGSALWSFVPAADNLLYNLLLSSYTLWDVVVAW